MLVQKCRLNEQKLEDHILQLRSTSTELLNCWWKCDLFLLALTSKLVLLLCLCFSFDHKMATEDWFGSSILNLFVEKAKKVLIIPTLRMRVYVLIAISWFIDRISKSLFKCYWFRTGGVASNLVPPNHFTDLTALHGFFFGSTGSAAIQRLWGIGSPSKPRRVWKVGKIRRNGLARPCLENVTVCLVCFWCLYWEKDIVMAETSELFLKVSRKSIYRSSFINSPSHKIAWPFHGRMNVLKVLQYPFGSVAFAINWSNPLVGIVPNLVHPGHLCQRPTITCTVARFPARNLNMQILGHRTTIFWSLRLVCWQNMCF